MTTDEENDEGEPGLGETDLGKTEFAVDRDWIDDTPAPKHNFRESGEELVKYRGSDVERPRDGYRESYDQIAYEMLQEANSSNARVCIALKISQHCLKQWEKKHPSFRRATAAGRLISEDNFRRKIGDVMYKPAAGVNTGLIKMMASNMHGINETPQIIINNNQSQDTKILSEKESAQLYADAIEKSSTELEGFSENFSET